MRQTYFVETEAEADRVVERLKARGFEVTHEKPAPGHLVTIQGAPSVDAEEVLIIRAPAVRRLGETHSLDVAGHRLTQL